MKKIPAIRVNQWLSLWDEFKYRKEARQRKPEPYFYVASIPAAVLRRIAGVRRRVAKGPRARDIGIQRGHDVERSEAIGRYLWSGYPWATLNTTQRSRFPELRKPGWLPTAIVANLVSASTVRNGENPNPRDLIELKTANDGTAELTLPEGADSPDWKLRGKIAPIEIIDGQHRLYAFEEEGGPDDGFEMPVVLFNDLDISWQAYLFWTINITPKRISPSLAYDLYPLLRTEDWLQHVEGPMAYRETRAQELTEALWGHPESPWRGRIGMLGRERGKVTQAAFVRSLTLSFVRGWEGVGKKTGGLFGTALSNDQTDVLQWSRPQQAAYLILLWAELADAVRGVGSGWAKFLRDKTPVEGGADEDPAFTGRYALLATDQGVRGFLQVCNDMSYGLRDVVKFHTWSRDRAKDAVDYAEVSAALRELRSKQQKISDFVKRLATEIAEFDWRSAATPELPEESFVKQAIYRGGPGYKEVRRQLLRHLASRKAKDVAASAQKVIEAMGYG